MAYNKIQPPSTDYELWVPSVLTWDEEQWVCCLQDLNGDPYEYETRYHWKWNPLPDLFEMFVCLSGAPWMDNPDAS